MYRLSAEFKFVIEEEIPDEKRRDYCGIVSVTG